MDKKTDLIEAANTAQTVSIIAAKHGCEIAEIDITKRIINLNCPADTKVACAMELTSLLQNVLQ